MPNRRHSSRRFTPSCSNSITNSCRCDMIDFSDHGTPAPPRQAKDADRMRQPCPRTPVHYLPGPYSRPLGGEPPSRTAELPTSPSHASGVGPALSPERAERGFRPVSAGNLLLQGSSSRTGLGGGIAVFRRRYRCHLCVKIEVYDLSQDGRGEKSPR